MKEKMSYKLYWFAGSAAMAPHAILNDTTADFELIEVTREFLQSAEYRQINPNAMVPALIVGGGQNLYESAAICQFLAEQHPETGLSPSIVNPDRGAYLQWMIHLTNTVQEAITIWWHPDQYTDVIEVQDQLRCKAEARLTKLWQTLNQHLERKGPLLCGEKFYACDYYLAMLIRWTRDMQRPGEEFPYLNRLVCITMARPAYKKMLQYQKITQNFLPK